MVGGEAPFARGRALLEELARIEVSVKAVERQARALGNVLDRRLNQCDHRPPLRPSLQSL